MTLEELIRLRDEIDPIRSDLEVAEAQAADAATRAQASVQARDRALSRLEAARARLAELIALRDQIPGVQAKAQAVESEATALTAQLSFFIHDTLNRLRGMVAELRHAFVPTLTLDALNARLGNLMASDLAAQLAVFPDVTNELRRVVVQFPFVNTQALLGEITALEAQVASLKQQRDDATALAIAVRDQLSELTTRSNEIPAVEAEVAEAEKDLAKLTRRADELLAELNLATAREQILRTQVNKLAKQYTQQLDGLIGSLGTDVPLALLPVRLETRFVGTELLVRMYLDDIQNDTHERELTKDEVTWGKHFWEQTWRAGTKVSAQQKRNRLAAWSQLAQRFGQHRAAWIARELEPTNQNARPADPVSENTPLGPAPTPDFPQPPSRDGSWNRAPNTKVLPDRWVALGYVNDAPARPQRVFAKWGELIPEPLPTGPSPIEKLGPDMADAGMRWMVNFDEAEKRGMGIRVRPDDLLQGFDLGNGFHALVVLGVKATLAPEDSSKRLHELLEAHHYTWGLGLVPQGTPTNNTPEVKSGFAERDLGSEISFATEQEDALCKPDDHSDGDLAAKALGFKLPSPTSPFAFEHAHHGEAHDQRDALHMNTVMWPATLGYFLTQLMEETFAKINPVTNRMGLDWGQYLEWRRYFIDHVRARGPLPVLRIANQPYGLLPVSSLDSWTGSNPQWPGTQTEFIGVLSKLRSLWRSGLSAVPHLSSNDSDPDNRLVKALGMDATSSSMHARRVLGPRYTDNAWFFLLANQLAANWWGSHDQLTREGLGRLELQTLHPRLAQASFAVEDSEIMEPLVQEQPLSETQLLGDLVNNDNYIAWLTKATPKDIHDHAFFQGQDKKPKPLLYRLLRHATLHAYAETALRKKPVEPPLVDPEFVDLDDSLGEEPRGSTSTTLWRHLLSTLTPDFAGWTPGLPHPIAGDQELDEFRRSLIALSKVPSAALQRLLCESLDVCSYRLDAWITSCVSQRLHALRQGQPTGIALGGYGWVENLRPRKDRPESTGFIHAPSLAHATTAAVLRTGYLSHKGTGNGEVLAVDLSSRRVRLAQSLIDGVRNGQPLGALLGYRFERGLHENHPGVELDKYIAVFRELAPLAAGKLVQKGNQPVEAIAANNVVDGLALLRRWQQGKSITQWDKDTIPFGNKVGQQGTVLPSETTGKADYEAIVDELEAMENAADAISDTAVAESVYQVVQGNPLRSGASLDAISRGEVPPQELDVVRTPRTGIGLTHRLLVMFSGDADPDGPTQKWAQQVRANAEPHLNAWVARLLGDPKDVLCQVKYKYAGPNPPDSVREYARKLSLKELALCPLDILYASSVSEQAQRSDLEQWLIYHALDTRNSTTNDPPSPGDVPANADVQLIFRRNPAWTVEKSFPELLEVARAARELVTGARAIDARDVSQPGQGLSSGIEMKNLKERADASIKALGDLHAELRAFFAVNDAGMLSILLDSPFNLPASVVEDLSNLLDLPNAIDLAAVCAKLGVPKLAELDKLRKALLPFAYFGIQGAVPLSSAGDTSEDRETLLKQARSVADNVARQLKRIDASTGITVDEQLARLREVFGPSFVVLPQFGQSNTTLNQAFKRRAASKDAESKQVVPWFQRIARIRDGARRLDATLMYAEAIGGDSLTFQVAQLPLPAEGTDRWIGLDLEQANGKTKPRPTGRLSLVAHTPTDFDLTKPLTKPIAGLLIDEWVEVVPNATETTAVTFHYDAPGACAPQAVLLAVPPVLNRPWDLNTLESILLETLELAKLRAVDPDALAEKGELGHYLPALYFAYNKGGDPHGDTIATDFKS